MPSLSSTGLAHRTEAGAGGRGCRKPAKMASKRPAPQESPGGGSATAPPPKKVHFEPFRIGQVSTLEDMDMKTLQFQNRKLAQRLEQRIRQENELRARVEQLEKRQTSDEGVLTVVNRWAGPAFGMGRSNRQLRCPGSLQGELFLGTESSANWVYLLVWQWFVWGSNKSSGRRFEEWFASL